MPVWNKSTMRYWSSGDPVYEEPCEVRIDGGNIVLSFHHEEYDRHINYTGTEIGDGHYRLAAPEVQGRATLHRFPDGDELDGWWVEEGTEGMWRVHLDRDE